MNYIQLNAAKHKSILVTFRIIRYMTWKSIRHL